ncbi:hypothetical protein V3851_05005 [Paenibacillus sp. M1]|uniref:DUF2802 domain-containing protein n=1 Tax=Paenibacillus haidiansis TaxID=1574488 RepID=A0ABU7VN41_9BACL
MSFSDPWFYVVLLGAAALVYALLLPTRKNAAAANRGDAGELEATLEQYMAEIEKENEELIDLVAQMKQDFTSKQLAQQEMLTELRQRLSEVEYTARQGASRLEQLEQTSVNVPGGDSGSGAVTQAEEPVEAAPSSIEETVSEAEQTAVEDAAEESEAPETVKDRYPELFDLYAKGKSIDTIAKTVGLQRGEVQLILQLAKREESL